MVLPWFSGRRARVSAPHSAAPEEMPASTPSLRPSSRAAAQTALEDACVARWGFCLDAQL